MLTVLSPSDKRNKSGNKQWKCRCQCGNIVDVTTSNLRSGNTKSCGCYRDICRSVKKYNKLIKEDDHYVGFASNNNTRFLFDACDYELVSKYTWREDAYGYLVTDICGTRSVRMHRLLLDADSKVVDHINGDTHDNRRCNLRQADYSTNQMNRKSGSNSLTGFKGVTFSKDKGKYFARITKDGRKYFLGYYDSIEDAINARIVAENSMFGDYSYFISRKEDDS